MADYNGCLSACGGSLKIVSQHKDIEIFQNSLTLGKRICAVGSVFAPRRFAAGAASAVGAQPGRHSRKRIMRLYTTGLVKKYKLRTVVNQVSIDVRQGEIVGLLGPNGAGKTTTFYMIVGLIKPNEGQIFLEDENGTIEITKLPVYKRAQLGVGYLAQEASVFRHLSVEDNLRAVLEMTDFPKSYQKERVETLLEEFRLNKVRKSKGIQLSGGERRRIEIARAVAINPKFILLDEPFAGVDPIAVEDIQSIVRTLKDKNIGVIITDHNVHETLSITDRTYLLFEGRVLKAGSAEDLANDEQVRKVYLGQDFKLR